MSLPFGRETAVERKRECPESCQSEWTWFGNYLGGKTNVIEDNVVLSDLICRKFHYTGITGPSRNVRAI